MTDRILHKATECDRAAVLRYLRAEPEVNIFIIGDVLSRGMASDIHEIYIQKAPRRIEGVLLRWRTSLVPYARDPLSDLTPIAAQASRYLAHAGNWMISGKQSVVRAVESLLRRRPDHAKDQFLCVCPKLDTDVPLDQLKHVAMAGGADAAGVAALMDRIEEFNAPQLTPEQMRSEIEGGMRRVAIIRHGPGGVVSAASAVAETGDAAMIIGVATLPEFRGKGYASACTAQLVKDLNRRGKSACLFYDNPAAGRIYHRLGFREIGRWRMITFGRR